MSRLLQTNFLAALLLTDLQAIPGDFDGQTVDVVGGFEIGDGIGEGEYYWDSSIVTDPVDEVTVQAAGQDGRWVLKAALHTVQCRITDVSTADNEYAVSPVAGRVVKIYSVLKNAITVADSALTTAIAPAGGGAFVAITGGNWTVSYNGSAAGDVDEATPSNAANNLVAKGSALRVTTDGGSTTTAPLTVFFVIKGA